MKMVTIYVDEKVWSDVVNEAFRLSSPDKKVSAGTYLMDLHQGSKDLQAEIDRLNKLIIGERVDLQIAKEALVTAKKDHGKELEPQPDQPKKKKIEKKAQTSEKSWSGGYSKEQQAGKKVKK